jgi:hypothetical protein
MKISNSIFVFFLGILLMLSVACKKKNDLVIAIDIDTIFVNDKVSFSVNVDFKVKEEEWKVLETNTTLSNVTTATYKFPAKGIYTIQYSAKRGFKTLNVQRKITVYALPGIIKNYWGNKTVAHADISLSIKGTRYDGNTMKIQFFMKKNMDWIYRPQSVRIFMNPKCF